MGQVGPNETRYCEPRTVDVRRDGAGDPARSNHGPATGHDAAVALAAQRWQQTFDAISDAVCLLDREGYVVQYNRAMQEAFGSQKRLLAGRRCCDAIHCELEQIPTCPFDRARRSLQREAEEYAHGDCWFKVAVDPLLDDVGGFAGAVHVVTDLTDHKRVEEALRSEQQKTQQYLDVVGDILVALDTAGRVTMFNRSGEELLGWKAEDVIGRDWFQTYVAESVRDTARKNFERRIAEELPSHDYFETPVVTRDGQERLIAWRKTLIHDAHGHVIGTLSSGRDITEQKNAQEAMRQAQQALIDEHGHAREVAEAEVARVRDELVRTTRLATIGQIAASIAHDLRNPLGAIRNAVYYLKRHGLHDQAKTIEYLGIIDEETVSADRIMQNLLDMVRTREPTRCEVDLSRLVRDEFKRAEDVAGIELRMAVDPDPFLIRVDPDQLRQVIRNLLTNAAQAMDGRGTFTVEASRTDHADTVVVRDTGSGIPPEQQATLFDPLVTTKARGTGLGLTICRQLIERHGGTIALLNSDRSGTAFQLQLPRPEPEKGDRAL